MQNWNKDVRQSQRFHTYDINNQSQEFLHRNITTATTALRNASSRLARKRSSQGNSQQRATYVCQYFIYKHVIYSTNSQKRLYHLF